MDRLGNASAIIVNNADSWNTTSTNTTHNSLSNWNASSTVFDNDTWIDESDTVINTIINMTTILNDTTTTTLLDACFNQTRTSITNATFTWNKTAVPELNTSNLYNLNDSNCNTSNLNYNYDTDDYDEFSGLISDSTLDVIVLVDYVFLSGIICFLGIVFNVINAVIFYRLGFSDTVNIMLFSLAITDLGALLPLLWKAVLFNPWFHDWEEVPFDYMTFQYYSGGWPHACFANISCLIIAFVTLDRCLCIAMPLKVRTIITPRRTVIIIAAFFVILTCSLIPLFCTVHFEPVFFEDKNATLVSLITSEEATFVENITLSFYTFNQLVALVAVILFTTILVVQLKKKTAWRMKASSAKRSNSNTSNRDTKIVKMVLFISFVYIICYVPGAVNIVVMIFVSEYSLVGRYKNICTLVWAKLNIFEAFNSTINIFIYIKMSSKYSQAFNKMFGRENAGEGGGGSKDGRSAILRGKTRNENTSVTNLEKDSECGCNGNSSVKKIDNDSSNHSNRNHSESSVSTSRHGVDNPAATVSDIENSKNEQKY